jgi:CheY-like chemotaxis protein
MMNKRVLGVEGHPELRRLVSMTLEQDDYEKHEANDGWGALEVIRQQRPHIVILDVMMPGGLDGYQVCETIKLEPETSNTTVMV